MTATDIKDDHLRLFDVSVLWKRWVTKFELVHGRATATKSIQHHEEKLNFFISVNNLFIFKIHNKHDDL